MKLGFLSGAHYLGTLDKKYYEGVKLTTRLNILISSRLKKSDSLTKDAIKESIKVALNTGNLYQLQNYATKLGISVNQLVSLLEEYGFIVSESKISADCDLDTIIRYFKYKNALEEGELDEESYEKRMSELTRRYPKCFFVSPVQTPVAPVATQVETPKLTQPIPITEASPVIQPVETPASTEIPEITPTLTQPLPLSTNIVNEIVTQKPTESKKGYQTRMTKLLLLGGASTILVLLLLRLR